MRIPFRLVDVFTDRPLAGNQLCVVPEPVDIPPELMQAIAREIGFSETTFVTEAAGDRYSMRIFTPEAELPFAGHPTLGTAYVLVSEGKVRSPATQRVPAGEFAVEVDVAGGFARMRQLPATFGPVVTDRAAVAASVGLEEDGLRPDLAPQIVSTGFPHLMAAARDEDAVARAIPDPRRLAPLLAPLGTDAVYLFSVSGDRAKARLFWVGTGISEDAATGSAAGPLGAYLAQAGLAGPGRLTVSQGQEMGRPSTLIVDVEPEEGAWRVFVQGGVVRVGEGHFDLSA
ncbi:MAG: PhzF family phenazine biosynthesis protein [Actinomycetota bacterium]